MNFIIGSELVAAVPGSGCVVHVLQLSEFPTGKVEGFVTRPLCSP